MTSTLSVMGLYQFDPNAFNKIMLPPDVDRDLLVDNLVCELGCLEVLYPSVPFMSDMMELWSKKELPTWTRLYNAMQINYNPIENYDRMEEWKDEKAENRKNNINDVTKTDGFSQNGGSTLQTSNDITDHAVTGYNSNSLVPNTQDQKTGTVATEDNTRQNVESRSERNGSTNEDTTGSGYHSGRVHGNIGVTTSQQMLSAELELVPQLNIINYIISSFKNRFCILIY